METQRLDQIESEARKHRLVGGALCLDFANTLNGHSETPLHEYLTTYADLVIWSHKAGILNSRDAETMLRSATRHPKQSLSTFRSAIMLREAVFRVFSTIALGRSPDQGDISKLDKARSIALAHEHICQTKYGYTIAWDDKAALDRMLWHIAASAAELLVSDARLDVRLCRGDNCDWLFVDTSRNHLRHWCSMEECGNRSKVRRYYRRRQGLAAGSSW